MVKKSYWTGKKRSKETIEKIRKAMIGKHSSPNTEFKKGDKPVCGFKKGRNPWNKGTKGIMKPNKTSFKKGSIGDKCAHWNGGVRTHGRGYIQIYTRNHPYSCVGNTVFEHRLIIEDYIGRYLTLKEVAHHINKIKDDNRIENLMAFVNQSAHKRFHKNPNNVKPYEIIFDGSKF